MSKKGHALLFSNYYVLYFRTMRLSIILLLLATSHGRPPGDKVTQVTELLDRLNLGEYGDLFVNEEINIDVLPNVTDEQLSIIGVRTLGQRVNQRPGHSVNAATNTILATFSCKLVT